MKLSPVEENYLKAIYHTSADNQKAVNTKRLAEELCTSPASVTDMIKRLAGKDLILYQKYKGVRLTEHGREVVLQIIRKHRLWEVFLVDKLDFKWHEVHEVAEQLEHIRSTQLVSALDQFLGFPSVDPHGDPIPGEDGRIEEIPQVPLSRIEPGNAGFVMKVPDDATLLPYLSKIALIPGASVRLVDKVDFDGSVGISIDRNEVTYLSSDIADTIMIRLL